MTRSPQIEDLYQELGRLRAANAYLLRELEDLRQKLSGKPRNTVVLDDELERFDKLLASREGK